MNGARGCITRGEGKWRREMGGKAKWEWLENESCRHIL